MVVMAEAFLQYHESNAIRIALEQTPSITFHEIFNFKLTPDEDTRQVRLNIANI